jgi:hypothetical protein
MERANGWRYAPTRYAGAGVDSVWEQKKLEARKMLENAARPSGSPQHPMHYTCPGTAHLPWRAVPG